MKSIIALPLAFLVSSTLAFPALLLDSALNEIRDVSPEAFISIANSIERLKAKRVLGVGAGFDASKQLVDTKGVHAFVAPKAGDLRGPCPGLNAMANHGYLPHNGIGTIPQFITQTEKVFGMGVDIATILAILGAVEDGDLVSWSIGGAPAGSLLQSIGLLGKPKGLNGSHNKYETDASPTRGDLYERGNNFLLQMDQFEEMFNLQPDAATADYTVELLQKFRASRIQQSISRNPYFFYGPATGILVEAAPFFFIPRFMGNKSAEFPQGKLNQEVLKSFFAITGDGPGSFTYTPGHERIPDNWYKRAIGDEYTLVFFALDVLTAATKYPQFISAGGNTGTVNSFSGLNLGDLSGGLYNSQSLLQGNNLLCFAFQALQAGAPDILKPVLGGLLGNVLGLLNNALGDVFDALSCPQGFGDFDANKEFAKYPGFTKLKTDGTY